MEEEEEVEAATELVTREVKKKKTVDAAALEKALEIAKEIKVPVEVLLKESSVEAAHKVIELSENLQQLVVGGATLNVNEEPHEEKVDTEHQWADIITKPLTVERFDFIKKNLNMHFVSY